MVFFNLKGSKVVASAILADVKPWLPARWNCAANLGNFHNAGLCREAATSLPRVGLTRGFLAGNSTPAKPRPDDGGKRNQGQRILELKRPLRGLVPKHHHAEQSARPAAHRAEQRQKRFRH